MYRSKKELVMSKSRRERLVGPIVSMPTFCDDEYNLLLDRQRKHVRWLMEQGIKEGDGVLLISGGVGETYMLHDEEYRTLAELVVEEAKGQVPTMVMIHELGARRAAMKAKWAADAGVDFALLSPPHYSLPTEDDIYEHHKYVNDAADIGIMLYNSYWVMPAPGYMYTARLLERLATLENVMSIKWSAPSVPQYLDGLKRFGDRYNFIENMWVFGYGSRYGSKGFIDLHGNAAPRLSLHIWQMMKSGRHTELDEFHLKHRFEPFQLPEGEPPGWSSVGDGWHALTVLKLLGLDAGPAFPGQALPSDAYVEHQRKMIEASGIRDWVDWDQSLLE